MGPSVLLCHGLRIFRIIWKFFGLDRESDFVRAMFTLKTQILLGDDVCTHTLRKLTKWTFYFLGGSRAYAHVAPTHKMDVFG